MMLHKESKRSHLLKLLALVPIVGTALALNAETVIDFRYNEPQKKIIKKGKTNATIKTDAVNEVVVVAYPAQQQEEGQTFKMRGVVKDKENGDPIVGAVITEANSTKGTVTGLNGEFTLDVKKGESVVAAYVGYASDAIVANDPGAQYVFTLEKDGSGKSGRAFDVVEQMPQFPGGAAALMQFLAQNIRYPEEADKNNIQGRVIVTFVVETDGGITEAKVVKSISPELDAEALRVINSMPNWIPGRQNGEAVRVKYAVPITFKLQGDATDTENNGATAKDVNVEVDGKAVDPEVLNSINPSDIESIHVEKAKDGQKKGTIFVVTKKNKE